MKREIVAIGGLIGMVIMMLAMPAWAGMCDYQQWPNYRCSEPDLAYVKEGRLCDYYQWRPRYCASEVVTVIETVAATQVSTQPIYFDFDKSDLRSNAKSTLRDVAQRVKQQPNTNVMLTGHCDSIGSDAYNQALGMRRAESAKDYLMEQGISESRLQTRSKGESDPAATNETSEGRQLNRRVEIGEQ